MLKQIGLCRFVIFGSRAKKWVAPVKISLQ